MPADELAMSAWMNGNAQMIWDERYGDAAEPPPLDQGGDPTHYTLPKFLYEHSIALPTTRADSPHSGSYPAAVK